MLFLEGGGDIYWLIWIFKKHFIILFNIRKQIIFFFISSSVFFTILKISYTGKICTTAGVRITTRILHLTFSQSLETKSLIKGFYIRSRGKFQLNPTVSFHILHLYSKDRIFRKTRDKKFIIWWLINHRNL